MEEPQPAPAISPPPVQPTSSRRPGALSNALLSHRPPAFTRQPTTATQVRTYFVFCHCCYSCDGYFTPAPARRPKSSPASACPDARSLQATHLDTTDAELRNGGLRQRCGGAAENRKLTTVRVPVVPPRVCWPAGCPHQQDMVFTFPPSVLVSCPSLPAAPSRQVLPPMSPRVLALQGHAALSLIPVTVSCLLLGYLDLGCAILVLDASTRWRAQRHRAMLLLAFNKQLCWSNVRT